MKRKTMSFSQSQLILSTVASVVLVSACASPNDQLSVVELDTLPGGIARVVNSGPAGWSDSSGWRLVHERTISPLSGNEGELINPRSVISDISGRVFVHDLSPSTVKAYGVDGEFIGELATEGTGPGEISDRVILFSSGDTLVIQDQLQTRAMVFNEDGDLVNTWPSTCCVGLMASASRDGRFPIPGFVARAEADDDGGYFSSVGFIRFDTEGIEHDTILFPRSGIGSQGWDANGKEIPIPFSAGDRHSFDGSGLVVAGHQSRFEIRFSKNGLDTTRLVVAPSQVTPIPDSLRRAAFDLALERMPFLSQIARLEDIPTVYPAWTDLRIDGRDNIWVMVPGPNGANDHWQVFNSDGVMLGDVPAPFSDLARSDWSSDHVHVILDNELTGLPKIEVYRIDRGTR